MADFSQFVQLAQRDYHFAIGLLVLIDVIFLGLAIAIVYWIGRFVKALELKWHREHERAFTRSEADRLNAPFKR